MSRISEINKENKLFEYEKFYLIKENNEYKIIIQKRKEDILIDCENYEKKIGADDISKIFNLKFTTLDEAYKFTIKIFEEKNVYIKEIIINKIIRLEFKKNKDIELILVYNKELKKEINNEYSEDTSSPPDLHSVNDFKIDSSTRGYCDNTFCVLKSINNIMYLIYSTKNKSIISYDLINNKKVNEIKNAHNEDISSFRHYLDDIEKRDLIISISLEDNNIKLWDLYNFYCLLHLSNINKDGFLFSACIFKNHNTNYILTTNVIWSQSPEEMKIFDFKGNIIKKVNNEGILFVDIYYDDELGKNYIIEGTRTSVISYDYDKNEVYHEYYDKTCFHCSIIIYKEQNKVKMVESSTDGNIRIWNFHSGILLKTINVSNHWLYGICLWNNQYLYVGCTDNIIKLIDLKNGKFVKDLIGHGDRIVTIKKMIHPLYGTCLLSQGYSKEHIKLWVRNNKY